MTFFFLVLLLAAVIIYIFWILIKPGKEHAPKKELRKKISEQIKKDPEMISRALSFWLNQK